MPRAILVHNAPWMEITQATCLMIAPLLVVKELTAIASAFRWEKAWRTSGPGLIILPFQMMLHISGCSASSQQQAGSCCRSFKMCGKIALLRSTGGCSMT